MTEADWLACQDPQMMLDHLLDSHGASERKMRLFAVACCRRIWHLLVHEAHREVVEIGERFADGLASDEERKGALEIACCCAISGHSVHPYAVAQAAFSCQSAVKDWPCDDLGELAFAAEAVGWANANGEVPEPEAVKNEHLAQADLVREIFGPLPFRNAVVPASSGSWR